MTLTLFLNSPSTLTEVRIRRTASTDWQSPGMMDLNEPTIDESWPQSPSKNKPFNSWQEEITRHLKYLGTLGDGWYDGSGLPIDPILIKHVFDFISSDLIRELDPKPNIVPTVSGGLQIEWHTEVVDLVIEPNVTGNATFYYYDNETGDEIEGSLSEHLDTIAKALIKLGSRTQ